MSRLSHPPRVVERVGKIPVVERDHRRDVLREQRVDQLIVEGETGGVDAPRAFGENASPRDAEAVRRAVRVRDISSTSACVAMVVIGGDVARVAVDDLAGRVREPMPDARPRAVGERRAFDLVRRRGGAPEKSFGKAVVATHLDRRCVWPSVTLKGVKKVYQQGGKDVTAVHGVDLEVKDGELVVLVGPSGCGKSTTLRMVAGLESISAGELRIGDRVVNDVPAERSRHRDGLSELRAVSAHDRVREHGVRAQAARDAEGRDRHAGEGGGGDLGHRASCSSGGRRTFRGGQRQRVAVGPRDRAEPRVFLFDEPLSNLDAKLRVQTRREIARLHQQLSATMIYVTHDQVEAMTLGDRIVVLEGGHVKQIDTPMNLYERPRNTFVAAFIGSPSMNLLPGAIVSGPGGVGVEFRAADNAFSIALSGEWAESDSKEFGGRAVIMGVRPEDIRDRAGGEPCRLAGGHGARESSMWWSRSEARHFSRRA